MMSSLDPDTRPLPIATADSQPLAKRHRKQVSRACDWCRARRIKCDNGQPCKACLRRDAECTHRGVDEPRTLPQALREIDKLKLRVKELENELLNFRLHNQSSYIPTPDHAPSHGPSNGEGSVSTSPEIIQPQPTSVSSTAPKPQWEGIHVATARSDQASYYGPISTFYFVSRIGAYLSTVLQQPSIDRNLHPRGASQKIHLGAEMDSNPRADAASSTRDSEANMQALSRAQEESFIRLFWEGYHCVMPVVDEVDFQKHYASLWDTSEPSRKQSPLVDIIMALCLQYGHSFIPRDMRNASHSDASSGDAGVAGRWYYRRSQSLLTADLESPTLTTVQCYIFTSVYLCCASFQNMSHIILAQAIRSAQILGLHLEPPSDLPYGERELRKRVWWILWVLDAKMCSKLGRPFLVDRSQVTVTQSSDGLEAATYNGATLGSFSPSVTWLTYSLHLQTLYLAVVDIYDALFIKCGQVMSETGLTSLYTSPQALETCAKLLATKMPALRGWMSSVPEDLKNPRRNGGNPYSTDRSALEIDPLAPTWLQRQRVSLELLYHSKIVNLTRPFITFPPHSGYAPTVERHATTCVDHAISFTLIMHQVVTETDLMSGWSEFFSWQWNAAITLVGFILANAIHPATARARQALEKAIQTFNFFGSNFAVSADAAGISGDLMKKADILAGRLSSGITPETDVATSLSAETGGSGDGVSSMDQGQGGTNDFTQFMDWALSVDSFNNFQTFFDSSNPPDPWAFTQP